MKKIVAFFILCFLALCATALAAPCGKITHVEGQVEVARPGKKAATPVSLGDVVQVGDIYSAKSRSKAEITFLNQNILRIAATTRIEIKEFMAEPNKSSNVVKLHRGKVQALTSGDLAMKMTALAEGRKFEVQTENAVAGVRDTNMVVGFEKGVTTAFCVSGTCYLYNPQFPGDVKTFSAGQISTITRPNGLPTQPRLASDRERRILVVQVTRSQLVAAAIKAGLPLPQVITIGRDAGMGIETIVTEAIQAGADPVAVVTAAISAEPGAAFSIVNAAVSLNPGMAADIVNAALTIPGVNSGSVITAAAAALSGNDRALASLRTAALEAGVPQSTVDIALAAAALVPTRADGTRGSVGGIGGTGGTGGYGYGAIGSSCYGGGGGGGQASPSR